MGFTLTSDFQLQGDHPSENRVWGFRGVSVSGVRKLAPQVVEAHRENRVTPTKTVSGIPYWLSRDPIAENGGINLYGYVYNNPVNYYDPHGLIADKVAVVATVGVIAAVGIGLFADAVLDGFEEGEKRRKKRDERNECIANADGEGAEEKQKEIDQHVRDGLIDAVNAATSPPATSLGVSPPTPTNVATSAATAAAAAANSAAAASGNIKGK